LALPYLALLRAGFS